MTMVIMADFTVTHSCQFVVTSVESHGFDRCWFYVFTQSTLEMILSLVQCMSQSPLC